MRKSNWAGKRFQSGQNDSVMNFIKFWYFHLKSADFEICSNTKSFWLSYFPRQEFNQRSEMDSCNYIICNDDCSSLRNGFAKLNQFRALAICCPFVNSSLSHTHTRARAFKPIGTAEAKIQIRGIQRIKHLFWPFFRALPSICSDKRRNERKRWENIERSRKQNGTVETTTNRKEKQNAWHGQHRQQGCRHTQSHTAIQ